MDINDLKYVILIFVIAFIAKMQYALYEIDNKLIKDLLIMCLAFCF